MSINDRKRSRYFFLCADVLTELHFRFTRMIRPVLFFLLAVACSSGPPPENNFTIVVDKKTDRLRQKAAVKLQSYWLKTTGRKISIEAQKSAGKTPILVGRSFLPEALNDTLQYLKEDGFIIDISDSAVFLAGNNPKAALYAVYSFLEDYLGCMKLSAAEEYIPRKQNIVLNKGLKIYNPSFAFRRIHFPVKDDRDYCEWYKLESMNDWGLFVHTFNKLIPPERYFDKHPEYFSLINGNRLKDGQLCLSNPEVIRELIKNLGGKIKEHPEKTYWSVSQNDVYNFCRCADCRRLYEKYGSVTDVYVNAVNKIAEAFPDKQISTLAYQFTRSAPKSVKPRSNVNIMLCTIECNRSMPLAEDPRSASFVNDMRNWSALTGNIFLWDYVVQFKNLLIPFPNFPVLQPNLRFFKAHRVDMIFEQGSGRAWSDLMELKQYLLAKLTWDVQADTDSLAALFINRYYGAAAPFIGKYCNTINKEIKAWRQTQPLNIYGFPSDYTDSFLRPSLMNTYLALMDSAETSVRNDAALLNRVKRTRLAVDFAWVDIAVNNHFKEMPAVIDTVNGRRINPLILHLLKNMEEYATKDNRIRVNERGLTIAEYKTYAINKLNASMKTNKLTQAKMRVLSEYSPKYPVGGAGALNDGLFGGLDFHQNWLGFEGHDMVVETDFGKETPISEIDMNFLKAVNSWVFLPVKIRIETSSDGKRFTLLQEQQGDNSDRSFLVKSVPFRFRFETQKTRFLRITAESMKTCPAWHRGYGSPSWIFVDEIIVN